MRLIADAQSASRHGNAHLVFENVRLPQLKEVRRQLEEPQNFAGFRPAGRPSRRLVNPPRGIKGLRRLRLRGAQFFFKSCSCPPWPLCSSWTSSIGLDNLKQRLTAVSSVLPHEPGSAQPGALVLGHLVFGFDLFGGCEGRRSRCAAPPPRCQYVVASYSLARIHLGG